MVRPSVPEPGTAYGLAPGARFTDPGELYLWIVRATGIYIPNERICEHHCTPWEAFWYAYQAEGVASVWKGSRGLAGKSFLLALLGWVCSVTQAADVSILGGSGEQSERVNTYLNAAWGSLNAPRYLLNRDPSSRGVTLANGANVRALLASQRSVRGPHPQRLLLDEVDEMEWQILESALGQPMARNGVPPHTVFSSTHQYTNGSMSKIIERAKDRDWPVFEWCYRETLEPHGWLTHRQRDDTRALMSSDSWEVEVELQAPRDLANAFFPSYDNHQGGSHVPSKPIEYNPLLPVWVGWDFGWDTTAIGYYQRGGTSRDLVCFAEDTFNHKDTDECIRELKAVRPWWREISEIYPDPAGVARTPQSKISDIQRLRNAFPNARMMFSHNPEHRNPETRAKWIREHLRDATGSVHVKISPSCKMLRKSLANLRGKEKEPDKIYKDGVHDHHVDQLGFVIANKYHAPGIRTYATSPV